MGTAAVTAPHGVVCAAHAGRRETCLARCVSFLDLAPLTSSRSYVGTITQPSYRRSVVGGRML